MRQGHEPFNQSHPVTILMTRTGEKDQERMTKDRTNGTLRAKEIAINLRETIVIASFFKMADSPS